MYVSVSVPEEDVLAVYELVLNRSRRPADAAAPVIATIDSSGNNESENDDEYDAWVSRIYKRVTPAGKATFDVLAKHHPDEVDFGDLEKEAAGEVENLGAAFQSIAIQSKPLPSDLPPLVEKRRNANTGSNAYTMNRRAAAIVRKLNGTD